MVGLGAMVANGWLEGIWTCVIRRLGQSYIDRSFGIAFIAYILNNITILMNGVFGPRGTRAPNKIGTQS